MSAIDIIKKWEGFSATPYQDTGGVWTIGWGHTKGVNENTPAISEEEAEALLLEDIETAQRAVDRLVTSPLSANQNAALVSFTFNLGEGNLKNSTLLKLLNKGEYYLAAREFERWVYAGQRRLLGLERRRREEAKLFCTP